MEDIFTRIVLGHLVGDFLLQSKKMAWMKSDRSWTGFWWCALHSLIYSLSVCLFLWTANPLIFVLVFMSHWPIDRWSLGNYWLKMIGGRDYIAAWLSEERWRELDIAFSCIVYVVTDNTLHLVLLWGISHLI